MNAQENAHGGCPRGSLPSSGYTAIYACPKHGGHHEPCPSPALLTSALSSACAAHMHAARPAGTAPASKMPTKTWNKRPRNLPHMPTKLQCLLSSHLQRLSLSLSMTLNNSPSYACQTTVIICMLQGMQTQPQQPKHQPKPGEKH